jgi:hypothetical protein
MSLPLEAFIAANRDELIRRCRLKVTGRAAPVAIDDEIESGIQIFIDQVADQLRLAAPDTVEIRSTAAKRGRVLFRHGFTIGQVVHDYGDVCQAITELAVELNAPVSTADFRTLNRCLDDGIADACPSSHTRHASPNTLKRPPEPSSCATCCSPPLRRSRPSRPAAWGWPAPRVSSSTAVSWPCGR